MEIQKKFNNSDNYTHFRGATNIEPTNHKVLFEQIKSSYPDNAIDVLYEIKITLLSHIIVQHESYRKIKKIQFNENTQCIEFVNYLNNVVSLKNDIVILTMTIETSDNKININPLNDLGIKKINLIIEKETSCGRSSCECSNCETNENFYFEYIGNNDEILYIGKSKDVLKDAQDKIINIYNGCYLKGRYNKITLGVDNVNKCIVLLEVE